MLDLIGWTSAIMFAFCGAPQAWLCYKTGNAHGLAWSYLVMLLVGEILGIIYIFPQNNYPILFNYVINLVFLVVMLNYKSNPRKN